MKTIRFAVAALIALILTHAPLSAQQTTLSTTTLSAAQTATATTLSLASVTNVAVGYGLYIDGEAEIVLSITGTVARVIRGADNTGAQAHLTSSAVYIAAPGNAYFNRPPQGSCSRSAERALPHIATENGAVSIFDCLNGVWVRITDSGYPVGSANQLAGGVSSTATYTANGAITVAPGVSFINGTTLAMTIGNPTIAQNGLIMIIESTNASAHTLTYTAGFNGGTTARDVATFGGAIGDNLVIVAVNGVWWVISTRNVTFG